MNPLRLDGISHSFSGVKAIAGVSFAINPGEITGIVGPNGAGKSTLFNIITGLYKPTDGRVFFYGTDITGLKNHTISKLGINRTFQNNRIFHRMSVIEHIKLSLFRIGTYSLLDSLVRAGTFKRDERAISEEAEVWLNRFGLYNDRFALASSLPYGKQKLLEIARILALHPKVLTLDEPAAGLNQTESKKLADLIAGIREDFKTEIILIEHNMRLVRSVCDRVLVLVHGELIADGSAAEVLSKKRVVDAYLGTFSKGLTDEYS